MGLEYILLSETNPLINTKRPPIISTIRTPKTFVAKPPKTKEIQKLGSRKPLLQPLGRQRVFLTPIFKSPCDR